MFAPLLSFNVTPFTFRTRYPFVYMLVTFVALGVISCNLTVMTMSVFCFTFEGSTVTSNVALRFLILAFATLDTPDSYIDDPPYVAVTFLPLRK